MVIPWHFDIYHDYHIHVQWYLHGAPKYFKEVHGTAIDCSKKTWYYHGIITNKHSSVKSLSFIL